jgi:hypothetical protein
MKTNGFAFVGLLLVSALVTDCSSKPSQEELQAIIVAQEGYPRQRDLTLDLANVYHAAYLTRAKLDEQGYVKVNTKVTINDSENLRRIEFTPKAKPFLIGEVEEKQQKSASLLGGTYAAFNQKIATYKIDFNKILAVRFNKDEDKAIVKYEAVFKELTPFANVGAKDQERIQEGETVGKEAYLIKYEQGWKLQKQPTLDWINF